MLDFATDTFANERAGIRLPDSFPRNHCKCDQKEKGIVANGHNLMRHLSVHSVTGDLYGLLDVAPEDAVLDEPRDPKGMAYIKTVGHHEPPVFRKWRILDLPKFPLFIRGPHCLHS